MNDAEFLQQLAGLNWLLRRDTNNSSNTDAASSSVSSSSTSSSGSAEDRARQIYSLITGARVVDEFYQRLTKKREIEEAWKLLILRVADYVQKNPRAADKEQVEFVQRELATFEIYVNSL